MEIQSTFYEPPAAALAAKWRTLAPEQFEFCIKAWQLITHVPASPTYRRLKSALSETEHEEVGWFRPTEQVWLAWQRTLAIAQALRAKVILFQCPASFLPSRENVLNLRRFMEQVERGSSLLAWEPRGEWPASLVKELCAHFDLMHCVDPFTGEQVHGAGYWRLHGSGSYRYRYTDADLEHLQSLTVQKQPAYVLFNNVWMKDDALRFLSRLSPKEKENKK